jgi:formate dehydrogenase (NADP+) beta subunit
MNVALTIDNIKVEAETGKTILEVARSVGIYIPALCSHPDLPQISILKAKAKNSIFRNGVFIKGGETDKRLEGCQLCLVEIEGRKGFFRSCDEPVNEGIVIHTDTEQLRQIRSDNLAKILFKHPHTCLVCPQREGCDTLSCSLDVPKNERCCQKFSNCELRKVAEYIGIKPDLSRYIPANLPVVEQEPLFKWDYNLCINCLRCVRVCEEVRGVKALGYALVENEVKVGSIDPTLKESGCKFCGACVEVCPTGALSDKEMSGGERESSFVPCKNACPAEIDIPKYVNLIAQRRFGDALAVIREKIPFPGVICRVCPHPCEDVCRRKYINEAVNIKELKRIATEHDEKISKQNSKITPRRGKKVAIVGSGPAGLTCGYYLSKLGHQVVIYEALSELGGMLRVGIPEYRLPRKILDQEIEEIKREGVEIKKNTKVESLDEIFKQGFDAVCVAIGTHQGIQLGIQGENNLGVIDGVSFLRDIALGREIKLGKKVAVIGGGNVAIDSARTSIRLGAEEVTILYRRSNVELPAIVEEVEEALREGVNIEFLVAPNKIDNRNGVLNLECLRMELGEPDLGRRRRSFPIQGSEFAREFDNIIVAIGQRPEINDGFGLSQPLENTLESKSTLIPSRKGIFVCGDVATGPSSVINAIAMARKCAQAIDFFLGGEGVIEERLFESEDFKPYLGREDGFAEWKRVAVPSRSVRERKHSFCEVILGYTQEDAVKEANRCLRCDLRLQILPPPMPPGKWLEFSSQNVEAVPETEGVYQLLDSDKNILYIKGAMNMRLELEEELKNNKKASFFIYEVESMYTKKESELLQQYLQQHRRLPSQNIDLDDLLI